MNLQSQDASSKAQHSAIRSAGCSIDGRHHRQGTGAPEADEAGQVADRAQGCGGGAFALHDIIVVGHQRSDTVQWWEFRRCPVPTSDKSSVLANLALTLSS